MNRTSQRQSLVKAWSLVSNHNWRKGAWGKQGAGKEVFRCKGVLPKKLRPLEEFGGRRKITALKKSGPTKNQKGKGNPKSWC